MAFITESDDIPRILTRNTTQKFRVGFFTDGSKTTPLIPKDPIQWPSYEILDPNGVAVQTGVLQADGGVGEYSTSWSVPADAMLSNPNQRYQFKAFIITNANEQAEITHEFDVKDAAVTAIEDRSQVYVTLFNQPIRLMIRSTERVDIDNYGSLSLSIIAGNTAGNAIALGIGGETIVTFQDGQITEVPDGDSFIYFFDVPGGALCSANFNYVALWTKRQNIGSPEEVQFQVIRTVNGPIVGMTVNLRQLIDKFQKQRGRVQAYEDSDLIEYLERGTEIVNLIHPFTDWNLMQAADTPFGTAVMIAAAWYGLNAQFLMEVDLGFAFSGQTVTLDYDHAPMLTEAINRFKDYLDENVSPAKVAYIRATSSVGVFAGKPLGYRGLHRFTFPLRAFKSGDILQTLSNIGIL